MNALDGPRRGTPSGAPRRRGALGHARWWRTRSRRRAAHRRGDGDLPAAGGADEDPVRPPQLRVPPRRVPSNPSSSPPRTSRSRHGVQQPPRHAVPSRRNAVPQLRGRAGGGRRGADAQRRPRRRVGPPRRASPPPTTSASTTSATPTPARCSASRARTVSARSVPASSRASTSAASTLRTYVNGEVVQEAPVRR